MVSSYVIHTTIQVDSDIATAFNQWVKSLEEKYSDPSDFPEIQKIPAYFDGSLSMNHTEGDGERALDRFLSLDPTKMENNIWTQNWRFDEDGLLVDNCEKFHGAISMLHYFIDHYFRPHGISLSGVIIGANTEGDKGYVYRVVDNVITMDVVATRHLLREYVRNLEKDEEDDYTYMPDICAFTYTQFEDYLARSYDLAA